MRVSLILMRSEMRIRARCWMALLAPSIPFYDRHFGETTQGYLSTNPDPIAVISPSSICDKCFVINISIIVIIMWSSVLLLFCCFFLYV